MSIPVIGRSEHVPTIALGPSRQSKLFTAVHESEVLAGDFYSPMRGLSPYPEGAMRQWQKETECRNEVWDYREAAEMSGPNARLYVAIIRERAAEAGRILVFNTLPDGDPRSLQAGVVTDEVYSELELIRRDEVGATWPVELTAPLHPDTPHADYFAEIGAAVDSQSPVARFLLEHAAAV